MAAFPRLDRSTAKVARHFRAAFLSGERGGDVAFRHEFEPVALAGLGLARFPGHPFGRLGLRQSVGLGLGDALGHGIATGVDRAQYPPRGGAGLGDVPQLAVVLADGDFAGCGRHARRGLGPVLDDVEALARGRGADAKAREFLIPDHPVLALFEGLDISVGQLVRGHIASPWLDVRFILG